MSEEAQKHLSTSSLILLVILILYTISAPLFHKYHFHYLHESGICMLVGVLVTVLASVVNPEANFVDTLSFDDAIFFTFILPPIVFAAGYNINRRTFMKYFSYIFIFGVIGTICNFIMVAGFTMIVNSMGFFSFTVKSPMDSEGNFTEKKEGEAAVIAKHHRRARNLESDEMVRKYSPVLGRGYTKIKDYFLDASLDKYGYLRNLNDEGSVVSTATSVITPTPEPVTGTTTSTHQTTTANVETTTKPLDSSPTAKTTETPTTSHTETKTVISTPKKPETKKEDMSLYFTPLEILLFASVISATDAVAALTFVNEREEPKLYAILFGEGVINDAVCIVLYGIIQEFTHSKEPLGFKTPFAITGSFISIFVCSFLVGVLVGILSSWFLNKLKSIHLHRIHEILLLMCFAYLSWILAVLFSLSPIISLLFNGITMSHYTYYNLSFQGRDESAVVSKIFALIAEAFVFIYLGLTALYYWTHSVSISFIILEIIIVSGSRVILILLFSYLFESVMQARFFNIRASDKGIMSFSGTIRGAIAFGLACSIESENKQNQEAIKSGTMALVFVSTIVFGALMPFAVKYFRTLDPPKPDTEIPTLAEEDAPHHSDTLEHELNTNYEIDFCHPNFIKDEWTSKEKNEEKLKERYSYWMVNYFTSFDSAIIKKVVCPDWQQVERDQEIFSRILKKISEELMKSESKGKESDFLSGDNLENKIREIRNDAFLESSPSSKKEKLVINTKDFDD